MLIDINQRIKLITTHPFFTFLLPGEIEKFAQLMDECVFKRGDLIVEEGSLVDQVFIIAEGEAEVVRRIEKKNKVYILPIAVLYKGQSIGLSGEGFFSRDGRRTASVSALTDVILLRVNVPTLSLFMQQTSSLYPSFKDTNERMMRTHFIKHVLPSVNFSNLDELDFIIDNIKQFNFKKGEIIFRQGEPADKCYLIKKGEVEITSDNPNYPNVAVLKPHSIFEEKVLTNGIQRDTTAKAIKETQLLALPKDLLNKLTELREAMAKNLNNITHNFRLPKKMSDVEIGHLLEKNGKPVTILKKKKSSQIFPLTDEAFFIWQQINGNKSVLELASLYAIKYEAEPEFVFDLILDLSTGGFINLPQRHEQKKESFLQKLKSKFK